MISGVPEGLPILFYVWYPASCYYHYKPGEQSNSVGQIREKEDGMWFIYLNISVGNKQTWNIVSTVIYTCTPSAGAVREIEIYEWDIQTYETKTN